MCWAELKVSVAGASLEQLGKAKSNRKDSISAENLSRCAKTGDARPRSSLDYHNLRCEATGPVKSDQRRYWQEIADDMETTAAVGHFGKLSTLIRSCLVKTQPTLSALRDGSSHLISRCEQELRRWVGHSSQLLNRPPIQPICVPLSGHVEQYEIDLDPSEELEIISAVQKMKSGKSPGDILPEI